MATVPYEKLTHIGTLTQGRQGSGIGEQGADSREPLHPHTGQAGQAGNGTYPVGRVWRGQDFHPTMAWSTSKPPLRAQFFVDCKHSQSFFRCVLWRIEGTIRSSSTSLKVPSTHTFGGTSTCPTVQPPFQKQNICAIMMPDSSAP